MRIKMLVSKVKALPGGGSLLFEAGRYYLAAPDTSLTPEEAVEWIMAGEAEDEDGRVVKPEEVSEDAEDGGAASENPEEWGHI